MRLFIALLFVANAFAIPQLINYQGQLADSNGTPLDTSLSITFKIWPTPAGGSPDWTETHPTVVVENGLFAVQLGSITALPDLFSVNRYIGITIGGDTEMTPRQQIVSIAHAYRVATVDGANGGTISGKINVGSGNTNAGDFSNVLGFNNTASGDAVTISGGIENSAGPYAMVGGGYSNVASAQTSTVSGGIENEASGLSSTVGGGESNEATGAYSTVGGGAGNTINGDYSFGCGSFINANSNNAFIFSDGSETFTPGSNNTANFLTTGGFRIWTDNPVASNIGARLPAGGGTWVGLSDSTMKRNARNVDTKNILEKVSALPIKQWSYKSQEENVEHIGPMAQDFWKLFHIGDDSLTISTIDPSGIALAAIQELAKQNQELRDELAWQAARYDTEIAELKTLVNQLIQLGQK